MQIILTPKESEDYFYNALCNGLDWFCSYGFKWECEDYDFIAKDLKQSNPNTLICLEDVIMEALRQGKKLTFEDIEGDGENTKSITLQDIHNNVHKTPLLHLSDMFNENGDAITADAIIQSVLFDGEIIYG